jgi:predicted transcriptional regulator
MNTKMTPVQKINIQENCGELTFQDQQYLVDFEVMNSSELRDKIRVKYELPEFVL